MIGALSPYGLLIKLALAAAALAAAAFAGSTWTSRGYEARIADMQREHADAVAEGERRARERERLLQEAADRSAEETARKINELEKRASQSAALGRRLRDELAAANSRATPPAEPVAAVDDPVVLRSMLVDLDSMAELFAGSAERCAVQLRGLQEFVGAAVINGPGVSE